PALPSAVLAEHEVLRTFPPLPLAVLAEHGATSDISPYSSGCFVRTWGYFRHIPLFHRLFCLNLELLQTNLLFHQLFCPYLGFFHDIKTAKSRQKKTPIKGANKIV
ncbi:hypothetical protein, partial [Mesobacillus boroniphilus]|uniref:hypothetical protein n=1 Tax=Mesobacillus boroniphilus TaxID=308892 RepID=UPI00054EFBC5